ncbi:MAG TPA: enoyl-CoA hydratase-related protein [Candidatus Binatia bacterium]|jgi:enoyl-CoA hydratase/carnithine racemase
MEYRDLRYEVRDHVATVTLDRPDRLNALSAAMLEGFSRALHAAHDDPEVRVVVLTGAGRGFCAGLDLRDEAAGQGLGASGLRFDLGSAPPVVLHNMDKPVIAAVNGAAAGYGLDLALGCDVRIAADDAKLAAVFTKRGVLPESGGSWLLPRLLGWAKAAEIAFRGVTLTAHEALELGLVNKVVPRAMLEEETASWAREIAANAPLAVQATKRMMRLGLAESFEANVHHVFLQLLPLFASHDFREGMAAFLEKRPARFTGR